MQFEKLLTPGGEMREFMRTAPGGGSWVDNVCDQLVLQLTSTHLEDLTLTYGAQNANVSNTKDGQVQLNVNWNGTGWSCYTAHSFDAAIATMWSQMNLTEEVSNVI